MPPAPGVDEFFIRGQHSLNFMTKEEKDYA
jgi:hypothetical protein